MNDALGRIVVGLKSEGGVKPPHSKVPSAQAFSEQKAIDRKQATNVILSEAKDLSS